MLQTTAKPTNGKPQAVKVSLDAVKRGKLTQPVRVLLYGVEKVGKSTFGSNAPAPVFLCAEDGTAELDVARLPEPRTWAEVLACVDALTEQEHEFKTIVLDTVDWLEPLVWAHVCKVGGKENIESFGFGKGYVAALDQWRVLLARLDKLRSARRMHVVLLGHAFVRTFANPEGENFDRYELKLHKQSAGVIKEWVDAVLFATHEQYAVSKDGGKAKGVSTGNRVVRTERHAAYDAGNRYGLPPEFPLSWDEFWGHKEGGKERLERAQRDVDALRSQVPADVAAKVEELKNKAGDDPAKWAQIADWLKGKVETKESV